MVVCGFGRRVVVEMEWKGGGQQEGMEVVALAGWEGAEGLLTVDGFRRCELIWRRHRERAGYRRLVSTELVIIALTLVTVTVELILRRDRRGRRVFESSFSELFSHLRSRVSAVRK